MMSRVTPQLLSSCLDDVRSRRITLESCLAAHPAEAGELRRLLETALAIVPLPREKLDPEFRLRARKALVEAISVQERSATKRIAGRVWRSMVFGWGEPARPDGRRTPMPAFIVSLALILTTAIGGGASFAAQDALPGDTLYPVKLTVEGIQIRLAPGDEGKAAANVDCAERRLHEAEMSFAAGRTDAAEKAVDGYSMCLGQAEQHLLQAAASGREISELATKLSENLVRQQAKLEAVQERVPEPARAVLAKALEASEKGLDTAIAHANRKLGGSVPVAGSPTATATSTAVPTPAKTPESVLDRGKPDQTLAPTADIPSALAEALAQALFDVKKLKDDPAVSGANYESLEAKLLAVQEAVVRGRNTAAENQAHAFLNQLNAMQRSGNISKEGYDTLYVDYSALVNALGGTPGQRVVPNRSTPLSTPKIVTPEPKNRPDDGDRTMAPTATPGQSTPGVLPGKRTGAPERESIPGAGPTHPDTPKSSRPDADDSRGRPAVGPIDQGGLPEPTPARVGPAATPTLALPASTPSLVRPASPTAIPPASTPRPGPERDRPEDRDEESKDRLPTPVATLFATPAPTPIAVPAETPTSASPAPAASAPKPGAVPQERDRDPGRPETTPGASQKEKK